MMRMKAVHQGRMPMIVIAGVLGALVNVGCGEEDPAGKTGNGLGTGGTIGKGGTSSGGSSAKGGASGASGSLSVGGAAGTATGGSLSVGGSNPSGGTSMLGDGEACAEVSVDSNKAEVALLFMVDISGSMNCPVPELDPACETDPREDYATTRWTEMRPALKAFFDSPDSAGMWAGISFFSRNNSCDARDYEDPDAEIALLPAAKATLDSAVDDQRPEGYTPTLPSLQGALNHADDWATEHTDQNVVVVYATDGYPKGCDGTPANTIDNAAAAAAKSFQGEHKIRTYVLGIGPNLDDLNKIAASGGTTEASLIKTGQDVTAQLTAKFNEIRQAVAVECTYSVPKPPAGQVLDPNKVNVKYGDDEELVPYNGMDNCTEGWHYTSDMKQVVLCSSTCDAVNAASADVQVSFGCSTVDIGDPR